MKKKIRLASLGLSLAIICSSFIPTVAQANEEVSKENMKVTRISGTDRYKTAVEASEATFVKGSKYVVVASGEGFSDALVGGTLASQSEAPILLVTKNTLPTEVSKEIKRLDADKVFLLGGTNTISSSVENQIKKLNVKVERLSGKNRVATAEQIAIARHKLTGGKTMGDTVSIMNGDNFADALAAAPFVGQMQGNYLYPTFMDHAYMIFGGFGSVKQTQVEKDKNRTVIRYQDKDRYGTAIKVADAYKDVLKKDIDKIVLVDGTKYPDALASASVASMNNAAILLTNPKNFTEVTSKYIQDNENIREVIIVGGTNSVSKRIEEIIGKFQVNKVVDKIEEIKPTDETEPAKATEESKTVVTK